MDQILTSCYCLSTTAIKTKAFFFSVALVNNEDVFATRGKFRSGSTIATAKKENLRYMVGAKRCV